MLFVQSKYTKQEISQNDSIQEVSPLPYWRAPSRFTGKALTPYEDLKNEDFLVLTSYQSTYQVSTATIEIGTTRSKHAKNEDLDTK